MISIADYSIDQVAVKVNDVEGDRFFIFPRAMTLGDICTAVAAIVPTAYGSAIDLRTDDDRLHAQFSRLFHGWKQPEPTTQIVCLKLATAWVLAFRGGITRESAILPASMTPDEIQVWLQNNVSYSGPEPVQMVWISEQTSVQETSKEIPARD